MIFYCTWCGERVAKPRADIQDKMGSFARWYGTGTSQERVSSYGVFCSLECRKEFKKYTERPYVGDTIDE